MKVCFVFSFKMGVQVRMGSVVLPVRDLASISSLQAPVLSDSELVYSEYNSYFPVLGSTSNILFTKLKRIGQLVKA